MMRAFQVVLAIFLAACAAAPAPPIPAGPTARLLDSAEKETGFRAVFFYVAEVNGKPIKTSLAEAREVGKDKGFSISPQTLSRDVPAGKAILKLEGRHAYGAPIQELVMATTMRSVTRLIEVDLKANGFYQVHGILEEGKDDVWLDTFDTGERVGTVVTGK
jgi:hypothetical protein